jgi:hypothetical protein
MKPEACTQYGCFSTTKVVESKEAVAVEPTPPNTVGRADA